MNEWIQSVLTSNHIGGVIPLSNICCNPIFPIIAVRNLLPRLRNPKETEVVIVTLPEATPVFEAERLQQDLKRAGITNKWWLINSSLLLTETQNPFLKAKAQSEKRWIEKVNELSAGNTVVMKWKNNQYH